MTPSPFGRQPQPVRIDFTGDLYDVEWYIRKITSLIENRTDDVVTRRGKQLTIHPRAVND